ncbi:hypothetical protein IWQ57_005608, partial [Coemansia nantahalensis]
GEDPKDDAKEDAKKDDVGDDPSEDLKDGPKADSRAGAPSSSHPAANGDHDEVPDPYAEGIYALSQAKRQRLGLDGSLLLELADAMADTVPGELLQRIAGVDIYVAGRPKPLAHITVEDERDMTAAEYTAYWAAWHPAQLA